MKRSLNYLRLAGFLFALAISNSFSADTQEFAFSVTPTAVAVPQGGEATALILLQNTGSTALGEAHITAFSNPAMKIKVEPAENRVAVAKGTLAWKAFVSSKTPGELSGTVFFQLDFTRAPPQDGGVATPTTVVASLSVTSQPLQKLEEVVEIKSETTIESLNEKRPGSIYLRLKSRANVPLTLGDVTVRKPLWVTVDALENDNPNPSPTPTPAPARTAVIHSKLMLRPHESHVLGFRLSADNQVTPGKQMVVFEVPLTWENAGNVQTAVEVITQPIDVGVFGETAVLAALGIPTFLFLPGFLLVMTFGVLWKIGKAKAERDDFPLKPNTGEFYLLAITISILAFWIYPILTKHFLKVRRDFTESYGLEDVVYIWIGSILLGLLTFGGFLILKSARQKIERLIKESTHFSTRDIPLSFLKKAAGKKLNLPLKPFNTPQDATSIAGFLVERDPPDSNKWWVTPQIKMKWSVEGSEDEKSVVGAIDAADIERLVKALKKAIAHKNLSLSWAASHTLSGPQSLEETNIARSDKPVRLLI